MKTCTMLWGVLIKACVLCSMFAGSLAVLAQDTDIEFQNTREDFVNALKSQERPKVKQRGVSGLTAKGISGITDDQNVQYEKLVEQPVARSLILFDFDSDTVKAESYPTLQNLAEVLTVNYPDARLMIAGHTDSVGKEKYNLSLSYRRAKAVTTVLMTEYGIAAERLTLRGFGESKPLVGEDSLNSKNRRVEFIRMQ